MQLSFLALNWSPPRGDHLRKLADRSGLLRDAKKEKKPSKNSISHFQTRELQKQKRFLFQFREPVQDTSQNPYTQTSHSSHQTHALPLRLSHLHPRIPRKANCPTSLKRKITQGTYPCEIPHRPSDAPSSTTPMTEAQPIKQEDIDALPAAQTGQIKESGYRPNQSSSITAAASDLPYPFHLLNPFYPLTHHKQAWRQCPSECLAAPLIRRPNDYEDLANEANLAGADHIKGLIKYVPTKDRNLWAEVEGEYYHEFTKVLQTLKKHDRVGKAETNRLFLEGFPSGVQQQIRNQHDDQVPRSPSRRSLPYARCARSCALFASRHHINTRNASRHANHIAIATGPATLKRLPTRSLQWAQSSNRNTRPHVAGNCTAQGLIEVDSSAFVHTITDADSEVDDEDLEVLRATQALALATTKCDQKKGNGPYAPKGKAVQFDWSRSFQQASDAVEIVSPAVQASSDKGKAPERAKTTATPSMSAAKPKRHPKYLRELMRTRGQGGR
ncbi:hypothetical protein DFJ58DRAFT_849020 [Suillus subalutaceus]|uniref:uncharacterized protein n=1 Tax=Suillus subalutaceus TaxID=48586 RepID=UPI001B862F91|nr:uncharacterized protein DFJ58DRAFT_849020 [Suillus subalutaceus]KAG1828587.1 hypothetical protein DFJ58DRAFT_849020 [Suillus subalutaceus]